MSSSTTPPSTLNGLSTPAAPRRWTFGFRSRRPSKLSFLLPRRDSGEWLPFIVLIGLLATAALQIALPPATELPSDPAVAPRRAKPVAVTPLPDEPDLLRAPIFSPDRAPGEAAEAGMASSPQALQIIGAAVGGRTSAAIVRTPDGTSHTLFLGQSVQGFRLTGLTATTATFVGPQGAASLAVGAPAATAPAAPEPAH